MSTYLIGTGFPSILVIFADERDSRKVRGTPITKKRVPQQEGTPATKKGLPKKSFVSRERDSNPRPAHYE